MESKANNTDTILNHTKLTSGEEYSLSDLFSTSNRKIIIPDFQRDYTWGDKVYGEKNDLDIVSGFLDTLFEEFKNDNKNKVLLGKIDVYENPKDHIYLTDGQQRLTTLYLIIGMLYKNTGEEVLKDCLISDYESSHDDKEPYLQYAIRESTVFFLRDLVNEFFISEKDLKVDDIKKQTWYFNEYNFDPSIFSMLSALKAIEKKFEKYQSILDSGFTEFIIHNVKIQYYDVENRRHGEERFVIINTTGKGLTVSENVKPILLGGIEESKQEEYANQWEDRETWFWQKRNKEKEQTADGGVNQFLTWCFQIRDKQEDVNLIKKSKKLFKDNKDKEFLKDVNQLFEALVCLISYLENEDFKKQFEFINDPEKVNGIIELRNLNKEKQENILLPLLFFIKKIDKDRDGVYQFLRRLRKNYFDNKWKERKANYVDWRYVLQIIEKSNSIEECLYFEEEFKVIKNVKLPEGAWNNEEEQHKRILKKDHEKEIEEWEDHPDFMGDLSFLFQTILVSDEKVDVEIPELTNENDFEFQPLKKIFQNYKSTVDLIKCQEKAKSNIGLANMFRLFRLYIGCNKVGHIKYAAWNFEGVLFSTLNGEHLQKIEFMKLLKENEDNLEKYCEDFVKQKAQEQNIFDLSEFKVEKFIIGWLTLKVFNANNHKTLLTFHDGNETGVAAYINKEANKLVEEEEFSWGNSICGYGVRSGFGGGNRVRTTGEGYWLKSYIIDTPFSDISLIEKFRAKEQIQKNQETIENIIELIENQPNPINIVQ